MDEKLFSMALLVKFQGKVRAGRCFLTLNLASIYLLMPFGQFSPEFHHLWLILKLVPSPFTPCYSYLDSLIGMAVNSASVPFLLYVKQ